MATTELTNLLEETLEALGQYGKSTKDIDWIGSHDGKYAIDWERFAKIAINTEYEDNSGREIDPDLVIVFRDESFMSRKEYDGYTEFWEYNYAPKKWDNPKEFNKVLGTIE